MTARIRPDRIYLVVLLALAKPLGAYMARVYDGSRRSSTGCSARRALIYRAAASPDDGMTWKTYASRCCSSTRSGSRRLRAAAAAGRAAAQPAGLRGRDARLVVQHRGELRDATRTGRLRPARRTMSLLSSQMLALSVQNFVSAAGRQWRRSSAVHPRWLRSARVEDIGNFWVDLTRCVLYIMLPFSRSYWRGSYSSRRASCHELQRPTETASLVRPTSRRLSP
jgi:K+-transporting ATPase ATPase A chain